MIIPMITFSEREFAGYESSIHQTPELDGLTCFRANTLVELLEIVDQNPGNVFAVVLFACSCNPRFNDALRNLVTRAETKQFPIVAVADTTNPAVFKEHGASHTVSHAEVITTLCAIRSQSEAACKVK